MLSSAISSVILLGTIVKGQSTFVIPPKVPMGSAKLDPVPLGLSFKFTVFPDLFSISNAQNCIQTLQRVTGHWPGIRIGGTVQDQSFFDPHLAEPVIQVGNASYLFGPSLLDLIGTYKGAVVLGLNRGGNNITNTIEAAKAALTKIKTLYAIELGNEPDIFAQIPLPIASNGWTNTDDAASEGEWQMAIGNAVRSKKIIQAGNFILPPSFNSSASFLLANEDPAAIPFVRDFSHHNYPQTVFPGSNFPLPNLPALMSHVNITENVNLYAKDTLATTARGMDYVFGETNSVSGFGSPDISETFGAALWVLDYTLRTTSQNIKRLYFHQGNSETFFYIWWTSKAVMSPFYGGYAAAVAMAKGAYITALDDGTNNFGGYVVYGNDAKPLRAVLVNSEYYNGTGPRKKHSFLLDGLHGNSLIRTTRLTAPNALSRQDNGARVTFGGQTFSDKTCLLEGHVESEITQVLNSRARIDLAATEAVIVELR